jgi:Mor family transcriptional regulator
MGAKRRDIWNDKDKIIKMYAIDKINPKEIAKIYKCHHSIVYTVLKGVDKHRFVGKPYVSTQLKLPEEEIISSYKNGLSAHEIANKYNCNHWSVYKILRKNNLKILGRDVSYKERYTPEKYNKIVGPTILRLKEQGLKMKDKTFEEIHGVEKAKEIKEKLIKNNSKYWKNKKRSEETINKIKENHKGKHISPLTEFGKLDKHPNWNNGSSFEPYTKDFNKMFKLAIKQRDGFMCLKCGMREEDHIKLFRQRLHIHHIDYIKENTFKENCCVLCMRCNMEVNSNRTSWTKFFQSLLSERYGYKYTEDGEIILNLNQTMIK